MKKEISDQLDADLHARLKQLAALPDEEIDTSDIPEVRDWRGARRGLFYTGPADKVAIGVDAETVAWFRAHSAAPEQCETGINQVLREHIERQMRKAS